MEIYTYSEFADMPILGPIPESPKADIASEYVEECRQSDLVESVTGADKELSDILPYDAKQYYENTAAEIAGSMGMKTRAVEMILHRSRPKLMRRLLIMVMLPVAKESEILEIIRAGEEKILKTLRRFF